MSRKPFTVLLSCLCVSLVGCAGLIFKKNQDDIAGAIEKIPVSKARFLLYSLDPHDQQIAGKIAARTFHGYSVLGTVEIVPEEKKRHLLEAFADGVRKSGDMSMLCFEPRLGLAVIGESFTNDFVICYSCLQVKAYGFNPSEGFLTSSSPSVLFNGIFDKYGIKRSE